MPKCVIVQRSLHPCSLVPGRDVSWEQVSRAAASQPVASCPPVVLPHNHIAYILYTSGTTGQPKGIQRDIAGYGVMVLNSMEAIFDVRQDDVVFTASDIGWIVGHSYIVYGPLMKGCTTVLYEGKPVGTPDASAFWRVVNHHQVNMMFTAPTALRAIKQADPHGTLAQQYDTSSLRRLYLAGERSDPDTLNWISRLLGKPIVDNWWQTETGSPMTSHPSPNADTVASNQPKFGSAGHPAPGWCLDVMDGESMHSQAPGHLGELVVRMPLPPGALSGFYGRPGAAEQAYVVYRDGKPWFRTLDAGYLDADGFCHVMTRIDDVINVAGHRLSTGQIEEIISGHPDVAECAVVGAHCALKGERPVALYVLKNGVATSNCDIALKDLVRTNIGAISTITTFEVKRLPKTRSGKILRKLIRSLLRGEVPSTIPPTIEDTAVVHELFHTFHRSSKHNNP